MSATTTKTLPPMRSALRKLRLHGSDALRPKFVDGRWHKPTISKRRAADLRKLAMRSGTYGSFDSTTGKGWDPSWDDVGKIGRLRSPKETKRDRTREERASKIESLLEGTNDKIEEHRAKHEEGKPEKNFMNTYKKMMKGKRK